MQAFLDDVGVLCVYIVYGTMLAIGLSMLIKTADLWTTHQARQRRRKLRRVERIERTTKGRWG